MLDFRLPTEEDRAALESYVAEHRAAGETGRLTAAAKLESMPFGSWLSKVYGHTSQDSPKSSYVMLCLDTDRPEPDGRPRLVGIVNIRPWLTEEDAEVYGHVGYGVRPTERRKGYGTQMMRYAIWFCRQKGLKRVVAGCYKANAASAGVLRKCGGVLYKEGDFYTPGVISQYYEWT